MNKQKLADIILRIGIAFSFIYAAIGGYTDPNSWIGYFPEFIKKMIPETTLLSLWGGFETILALWILYGKNIFWPSLVASLSLAGLILTNLGAMDIIFRDVTILATTIALTIQSFPRKTIQM
ncbi:MAG: hypothetical protein EXS46_03200 [Candidatus Taylorbacteria bacterium]|nr:hypothetical protein [Candidatus Taylorbacteria bacterium]